MKNSLKLINPQTSSPLERKSNDLIHKHEINISSDMSLVGIERRMSRQTRKTFSQLRSQRRKRPKSHI